MILNQLLPKSFKMPEINTYDINGLSYEDLSPYLVNLPVSDKLFGLDIYIDNRGIETFFITESHKLDLSIQKKKSRLLIREYGESSCYYIHANKSPIFPFQFEYNDTFNLKHIAKKLKPDELIVLQIICVKRHAEHWQNRLWEQYEDYVNGIEVPTSNKLIRSIQHRILEFYKKLEGGYRRNERIKETEKKLTEDMFQVEIRFMLFGGSKETRQKLSRLVYSQFNEFNYINSWVMAEDKDFRNFFKDVQLRRPSLIYDNQILCVSELKNLLSIAIAHEKSIPTSSAEQSIDVVMAKVDEVEEAQANNPFSLFPRGIKKNRDSDIHLSDKLNKAFRKLSLISSDVVIQKIQHGPQIQNITFSLPSGLKLTELTKAVPNIQAELALSGISFQQGDLPGTVCMSIPQIEREFVFVRDCVDSLEFQEKIKKYELPILFGQNPFGEIIVDDLFRLRALLVAGLQGSGKSVFINNLLCVLFSLVNPRRLNVYLIDPKRVEMALYADFPHVQGVYTDMDEAEGVLCHLVEKMEERYKLFEKKGYRNLKQYNENEKEKLPYIIFVLDELADLIMTHPEVEEHIVRISQLGRAAGFFPVIATQKPIADIVTSLIKGNIYSRVCFACDSGRSYMVALDCVPPFTLLGKGDGAFRLEGIQDIGRFQAPLIGRDENEQDRIIKKLSSFWKESVKKDVIDIQAIKEKKQNQQLNEFKRVVLETGETRITELQKVFNVRVERIKELMMELISLGWVKQHKSRAKGFELLLNEDQRKEELSKLK